MDPSPKSPPADAGTPETPRRRAVDPYAHAPRVPSEGALTVDTLVPGAGPVMLEIGPGRGRFAVTYCVQNPSWRLLGFEIRRKHATLLDDKLRAKKHAARCFAEDARAVLDRVGPDGSVDAVAVHFPDPWWKKKHAKRLVVADALVAQLARLVRPGGVVLVQTDVPDRAHEYAARFGAAGSGFVLREPEKPPLEVESPFAPARSNREARAIEDGLPVYRLVYLRAE